MRRPDNAPADPEVGLERLLETEAALQGRLVAARGEAERLIDTARAAAADARSRCEAAAAGEVEALGERIAAGRDGEIREVRADLDRRRERFRTLTPEQVDAIARALVDRLLVSPARERLVP